MASETGKLIKKGSKLDKILDYKAYPWLDFSEQDLITADNPRKSIVLTRFHDSQEVDKGVKLADQFAKRLQPPIEPLIPIDLTRDYLASQEELMVRRRRRLLDEDEAMALELADLVGGNNTAKDSKWRGADEDTSGALVDSGPDSSSSSNNSQGRAGLASQKPNPPPVDPIPHKEPAHLPSDLTHELVSSSRPPDAVDEQSLGMSTLSSNSPAQSSAEDLHGPLEASHLEDERELKARRDPASSRERLLEEDFEKRAQIIKDEAYEKGRFDERKVFEDKFKDQEQQHFKRFQDGLANLARARSELIGGGKDIFLDIVKLCAEQLIRSQISTDDKALTNLFSQIVDQLGPAQNIRVELNGSDLMRLRQALSESEPGLGMEFVENSHLRTGDFLIDLNQEKMRIELKKLIEHVIDDLKKDLFIEPKKGELE